MLDLKEKIENINKQLGINNIDEVNKFPRYIEIEAYDGCNINCIMCPLGKNIYEGKGGIDLKTFEIPYNERDHALYIAFGPYKNPRYALSVVIEYGGSGSATAAPLAKELFKLIIDRHKLRENFRVKGNVKI